MITHVVLFKVKTDIDSAKLADFEKQVRSLTSVPGVQKLSFGQTFKTERARGYTHVLVVELPDKQVLDNYATNEYHVSVVKNYVLPNVEQDGVLAMDIEQ